MLFGRGYWQLLEKQFTETRGNLFSSCDERRRNIFHTYIQAVFLNGQNLTCWIHFQTPYCIKANKLKEKKTQWLDFENFKDQNFTIDCKHIVWFLLAFNRNSLCLKDISAVIFQDDLYLQPFSLNQFKCFSNYYIIFHLSEAESSLLMTLDSTELLQYTHYSCQVLDSCESSHQNHWPVTQSSISKM